MNTEQESIVQTGIKLYACIYGAILKTTDGEIPWGGSQHMIRILARNKNRYFKKGNSGSFKSCVTESFYGWLLTKFNKKDNYKNMFSCKRFLFTKSRELFRKPSRLAQSENTPSI